MSDAVLKLFDKLKEGLKRVHLGGETLYVAEGDLLLNEEQLLLYAGDEIERRELDDEGEEKRRGLVGIVDAKARHVRWQRGLVLSYSVVRDTFPDSNGYDVVVGAMKEATGDWERICNVKFRHDADQDSESDGGSVLFDVQFIGDSDGSLIAAAFFPNDPVSRRHMWIDPTFFSPTLRFDKVGVLRHELGHVLGFRHEHIRRDAMPGCPGESLWGTEILTDYDPQSVMHYFCGDVGSEALAITDVDRVGAQKVYGPPDRELVFFE